MEENPKSPVAEAFRTLRTNIQFSGIDKSIRSITVTSSKPEEGKSTVSVNMAITMAQSGNKVLLVEGDLRKPTVYQYFSINSLQGLTSVLVQGLDYREVIYKATGIEGLDVITSGPIPPNPAELLGSDKMKDFVKEMEKVYDMVVIDTPPIGVVTDGAVLSTLVDGTLLVCASGEAEIEGARRAKDLLDKVNANILGVILNKVPVGGGAYYTYDYGGYYGKSHSQRVQAND